MKTKTIFILGLLMLFTLTSVQAGPIVELSVDDTWAYTGTETFDYTVIDKQDFQNGEEYVELIKIESNEIVETINPSLNVVFDENITLEIDLQVNFTSSVRWHTARGNFLVLLEKTGTFILDANINFTYIHETGTINYKKYYLNFDLQSPLIDGNPIYAERIISWELQPINFILTDKTIYRIDGTDEFTVDYQGQQTQVRNVTIVPHSRTKTFFFGDYIFKAILNRPFSVDGMKQYLWVFANNIGLPIYKESSTLSLNPLSLTAVDIEKYDLTAFSVALSDFEIETTNFNLIWIHFLIGGLVYILFSKKRKA